MRARAALMCLIAVFKPTANRSDAAEPPILECTLDRVETVTPDAKRATTPMRSVAGNQLTTTLVVVGLGTATVTAKDRVWSFALGDRVLPMPAAPGQLEDGNDWFYARSDQGVTVLQIPKVGRPNVEVRLHNLGIAPYTFVGRCH
jgi:hypothetical protein